MNRGKMVEFALTEEELERALLKQIQKYSDKKLIFWGASVFLKNFIEKYDIKNENIIGIIDKNPEQEGKNFGNYKIFSPNQKLLDEVDHIIFSIKNNANKIYNLIKKELEEKNINKILPNIFKYYDITIQNEKCQAKSITPQTVLNSIAVHLVDHCNLKCWGCDHFSPLAETCYQNIETFENDIKQYAKISKSELNILKLMGGEPLLHPEIVKFMEISRKYLPNTRIEIVTNAILLTSQKEDFWQACKKYNITIVVTKYPLEIDYNKIQEIIKLYEIDFEYYNEHAKIKTSYHIPLKLDGNEPVKWNFENCFHANNCVFLKNGKLFTCTVAPNIEHFNKFFNCNIKLDEKDGIDIYKAKNITEILEFLAKPIPFCKYCDVKNRTHGHTWGLSQKDIKEWTCI